jgi:hypothetical protein
MNLFPKLVIISSDYINDDNKGFMSFLKESMEDRVLVLPRNENLAKMFLEKSLRKIIKSKKP